LSILLAFLLTIIFFILILVAHENVREAAERAEKAEGGDFELKMGRAKLYACIQFSVAAACVLFVFLGYYFVPDLGWNIFQTIIDLFFTIMGLRNGFIYTSRYKHYRDQFQGLEPPPDEESDEN